MLNFRKTLLSLCFASLLFFINFTSHSQVIGDTREDSDVYGWFMVKPLSAVLFETYQGPPNHPRRNLSITYRYWFDPPSLPDVGFKTIHVARAVISFDGGADIMTGVDMLAVILTAIKEEQPIEIRDRLEKGATERLNSHYEGDILQIRYLNAYGYKWGKQHFSSVPNQP